MKWIKSKFFKYLPLIIILSLALFLRLYKLDVVPPSLSWDEAANGYNAYTIANFGKDEWGVDFPLYFHSFGDDKNPVHIYITALFVKVLGSSDFTTRLPEAIFGVLCVATIFLLGKIFFKNIWVGLIAALFLAISPYNLQFSRFSHEAIFALFFFMFGILLFLKSIKDRHFLLPISAICFSLSILSYHSSKLVVPLMIVVLFLLYIKDLLRLKKYFAMSIFVFAILIAIFYANPQLLGAARLSQASLSQEAIESTGLYKKTGNSLLGRIDLTYQRYLTYFSWNYLFVSGDPIERHSSQAVGEFYKIDALFLIVGFLALLAQRSKATIIILSWALIAPIPASATGGITEISHAARALFTMGSWHLVSAFGFYNLIKLFRKLPLQLVIITLGLVILAWMSYGYLQDYYNEYPKRTAIEWQYGMKQITEFVADNPEYYQVYMTDVRAQPYIFFLYYLKSSLSEYLENVKYNNSMSRSSNVVSSFGLYNRFRFGGWDQIESYPDPYILYVVAPSQYDGLRHKDLFQLKKHIKYPNGTDAFFLVSAN